MLALEEHVKLFLFLDLFSAWKEKKMQLGIYIHRKLEADNPPITMYLKYTHLMAVNNL